MIEKIRHFSSTWWFRTFLGLVAVTFAVLWGGGDWMHNMGGGRGQVVATVGAERITTWQLRSAVDRRLRQIAASTGQRITEEDALKAGLFHQVLDTLIQQALIAQEAHRLGITLTDESVRKALAQNKSFFDPTGKFDKQHFLMVIERLGYNEASFVAELRQDLIRQNLLSTLFQNLSLPSLQELILYKWQEQTRQVLYTLISSDDMAFSETPKEEDIKELFTKYKEVLKAPEYRDFSVLVMDPKELAKTLTVSQEELEKAYADRPEALKDKSLDVLKAQLEEEVRHQKALSLVYEHSTKIEDDIAAGSSLKEIGVKYKLPVLSFQKVDASGSYDPFAGDGAAKLTLSDAEKAYVREAFTLEPQTAGAFVEGAENVSFLVHVDKVQEAHERTATEVPPARAAALWVAMKKKEMAAGIAAEISKKSQSPSVFLTTLQSHGLKAQSVRLTRRGPSLPSKLALPERVVAALFQGNVGQTVPAPLESSLDKAVFFVGCVEGVTSPDVDPQDKSFVERRTDFDQMYQNDYVASYLNSLAGRFPVERNNRWLEAQLKEHA